MGAAASSHFFTILRCHTIDCLSEDRINFDIQEEAYFAIEQNSYKIVRGSPRNPSSARNRSLSLVPIPLTQSIVRLPKCTIFCIKRLFIGSSTRLLRTSKRFVSGFLRAKKSIGSCVLRIQILCTKYYICHVFLSPAIYLMLLIRIVVIFGAQASFALFFVHVQNVRAQNC